MIPCELYNNSKGDCPKIFRFIDLSLVNYSKSARYMLRPHQITHAEFDLIHSNVFTPCFHATQNGIITCNCCNYPYQIHQVPLGDPRRWQATPMKWFRPPFGALRFRKVLVETCMTTNWLSIYLTLCV